MKKINKELVQRTPFGEILSAYIDGELSTEEIEKLEREIALSHKLQKKLAELRRIKELTASSFSKIQEAPYFETRLMAALENEKPVRNIIKKWSPVIGIAVFTVALMFFLKFNPKVLDKLVEEQKSNLAGFYTQNLKPLLFAADLTNEDIFDFAFYKKLPLDNSNKQFLQLGSNPSGGEYFEIKTANNIEEPNNLEKFVNALSLTEEQKRQMDSIISDYAEELQSQVLVNENNTVAINPNLWNYQKAIVADILSFAKNSNEKEFKKVIPAGYSVYYDKPSVDRMVREVKSAKDNEYIFFTPDTIFKDNFYFDKDKFKEEMQQMRQEMKRNMENVKKNMKEVKKLNIHLQLDSNIVKLRKVPWNKDFQIFIDSNICRINLNNIPIPEIEIPDMDSIEALIEEATKNLKDFSFSIPELDEKSYKFDFRITDSSGSNNFDIRIPNVDSIISMNMPNLDSLMKFNWKYNQNPDSALSRFKMFFDGNENFEFRMRDFEKEMEKLKEEMNRLKKEIRKDSAKSKEGVEI